MLHVINCMEIYVEKCILDVVKETDGCTCDKCLKDIYALTLNNLKPYYIVSTKGINGEEVDSIFEDIKENITKQLRISRDIVQKNLRHNQDEVQGVYNYAEAYVEEFVKKSVNGELCDCKEYIDEIYVMVLNNIKPLYVVTTSGQLLFKLESSKNQYRTNILMETVKAINYIKEKYMI